MADKQPIAQVECHFGKVGVGEVAGCVTMGCRPQAVMMTPDEARALATYLNAVADGIEGKPVAPHPEPTYFDRCVAAARELVAADNRWMIDDPATRERWKKAHGEFFALIGGPKLTKARMLLHIADQCAPESEVKPSGD